MDWPATLGLLPDGADRAKCVALLRYWEGGLISGCAKSAQRAATEQAARAEFERNKGR